MTEQEVVAGIDWASVEHAVCVVDDAGIPRREWIADHDEAGITALCAELVDFGVARVAIERPDGILVDRLLAANIEVIAVHPNQAKAARDRYQVARGKSDRFDAFVLAELARTDAHRLRAIVPDSDDTRALRALTRTREDLVQTRVELANQLRAQLQAFWPGALIFSDVDSPISLAFIARYPAPTDAKGLGPKRLAGFLARHRYCGRKDPAELVDRIRQAPTGRAGEQEIEARRAAVLGLVAALEPIVDQIAQLTSQIRGALADHPDAEIFQPLFRDKTTAICPATLIAELGDARSRYPTEAALAADAGMAPVAVESGKRRAATFRRACDKRLRHAMTTLADSTRHWHPWARHVYTQARNRGQDHPHAIRTLGRAWTRVLWKCWHDQTPYDPTRHGNLNRLKTQGG
jgi:transposase